MQAICDTHVLLYWADQPKRLSKAARKAVDAGMDAGGLLCADITLWEIAMLFARGRLNNQSGTSATQYIQDILAAMDITVLPITAEIAELAQTSAFSHGDPADRLIGATALAHHLPLITADRNLQGVIGLRCIW